MNRPQNTQLSYSAYSATDSDITTYAPDSLAFVYDGTLEGLLCAVFAAYETKVYPSDIAREENYQPRLGQEVIPIETEEGKALRVQHGICKTCGPAVFEAIKTASLSSDYNTGSIIHTFIRYAMTKHKPHDCGACPRQLRCDGLCTRDRKNSILTETMHPSVAPLCDLARSVYNEEHRMKQFLRFEHFEGDLWFAQCNPKASVVPLIMDWFAARFNVQPFMIYDEVHHLAGVYEGRDWFLIKTDSISLPQKADDEVVMQQAWKRFYNTIAVESRYNPELRRQFMPKRFWRNIVEMHEDLPHVEAEHGENTIQQHIHTKNDHTPLLSNRGIKLS